MKAHGKSVTQHTDHMIWQSISLHSWQINALIIFTACSSYSSMNLASWCSVVKLLACRRFAFHYRIADAKNFILSDCELFPSLITAQLSPPAALRHTPLPFPGCNLLMFLFQVFSLLVPAASFFQVNCTLEDTLDALSISVTWFF